MTDRDKRPNLDDYSWQPLPYEGDPPSPEDDPFYSEFDPPPRHRPSAHTYGYRHMDDDFFASVFGFIILVAGLACGGLYFSGKGVLYNRHNDGYTTNCYYWTPFSTVQMSYGDGDNGVYCPRMADLAR